MQSWIFVQFMTRCHTSLQFVSFLFLHSCKSTTFPISKEYQQKCFSSCGLEARGRGGGRGGRNRQGRHHDNPIKHLLYPRFNRYDRSLKPTTDNADQQLDVTVNMFVRELGPLNYDDNVNKFCISFCIFSS